MRKAFAILMIAMMMMCFMPSAAFAYDAGMAPGQICAEKTVAGPDEDGNYELTLSVTGKNVTETTGANADVVLVVDNSGSMREGTKGTVCGTPKEEFVKKDSWEYFPKWGRHKYICTEYECQACGAKYWEILQGNDGKVIQRLPDSCRSIVQGTSRITVAKEVAKDFAEGILKNNNGNMLALIGFSNGQNTGGSDDSGAIKVSNGLTDSLSDINGKIDSMQAEGGTNYSAALKKAYEYLNSRTDKTRPGYVLFISDGAPGYSGESLDDEDWNGSKQIEQLKEAGITVFTVGIALSQEPADYLKNMAADGNHFINVTGDNYDKQLSSILELWAKKINSRPAGTEAVMEDIVDMEKFQVVGFSSGIKHVSGGKYVWAIGDITERIQTQTIKIKPLVSGTDIYTNTDVNLTYKAPDGEPKTITKDKIGEPTVDVAQATFNVENGKWADGTADPKVVLIPLSVTEGKGTLNAKDVPTGMKAAAGYEGGAWDAVIKTGTGEVTGPVTYTYTFSERQPVTTDTAVTFRVVNGTWEDGTTADKSVVITLTDGKGTLNAKDVPTGMKAAAGYKGGAWDAVIKTGTGEVTGPVTYTYTFKKISTPYIPGHTVYYTIKWNNFDGTNLETDRFCYYGQMPSYDGLTPAKPADQDYTYEFIGWDKEIVKVTKDETYTAQFKAVKAKPEPTEPTEKPEKPAKPEKPIGTIQPEKPAKPEKPTKPCRPDTEVPKTGDTAAKDMSANAFMLTLSALGIMLIWYRKKEKN